MFLFDRQAELILSTGYEFSIKEGSRFRFSYSTTGDTGIPIATIDILNITRELREQIEEDTQAIFNIGYGEEIGELCSGVIKNVELTHKTVKFDILSDYDKFSKNFSQWYDRFVREDFIVKDIASNLGLHIKGTELLEVYRQDNGYTVTGQGLNSIRKICNNRDVAITTRGNLIELYKDDNTGTPGSVILKYDSGLIDVNKYKDDDNKYDYIVKALPIPTLAQGDIIRVESFKLNAICKIIDYEVRGSTNWESKYYVKIVG